MKTPTSGGKFSWHENKYPGLCIRSQIISNINAVRYVTEGIFHLQGVNAGLIVSNEKSTFISY